MSLRVRAEKSGPERIWRYTGRLLFPRSEREFDLKENSRNAGEYTPDCLTMAEHQVQKPEDGNS
jgi:hypothetical protein